MKIVVDNKIPYIQEALTRLCDEVIFLDGSKITHNDVKDADALIVRTRTQCNEELLKGSKVSFIATATIGYDHLDIDYLKKAHIAWTNCPGCNASSVGQYIRSCLILLEKEKGIDLTQTTIGIVGVGHVGKAVINAIKPLGIKILKCDPPVKFKLEQKGLFAEDYLSLRQLQDECDIISFHTPLTKMGDNPTFHLADTKFFKNIRKNLILINSSRGAVVDNVALLEAIKKEIVKYAIIDTWENEPHINKELLFHAYIGTPHIAGYSADGKANASRMTLTAICQHFHIPLQLDIHPPKIQAPKEYQEMNEKERSLFLYNPHRDSKLLKDNPDLFEKYRGDYPLRREFIE